MQGSQGVRLVWLRPVMSFPPNGTLRLGMTPHGRVVRFQDDFRCQEAFVQLDARSLGISASKWHFEVGHDPTRKGGGSLPRGDFRCQEAFVQIDTRSLSVVVFPNNFWPRRWDVEIQIIFFLQIKPKAVVVD